MKIAYISYTDFSDCDLPLVKALVSQGVDVTLYLIISDNSKQGAIINIERIKDKCGVFPASDYPELGMLSSYISLSKVWVANMNVAHNYAPSTFHLGYKLRKALKNGMFDLIHLTWPVEYPFFSIYTLRVPFVLTVHDPILHSSAKFREKFKRYVAFKRADRFILLNKVQRPEFETTYHIDASKIDHSQLSIYTHLQNTPVADPIVSGEYILFTGAIHPYKGIKYIVQAMGDINKNHPDIKLVIAGRGNLDFDISPYLKNGNIVLINRFVSIEELASLISYSKFVCCPYTDATQSGVVMSAFALNKPVLATDVGALHEMITDGEHGSLVPPCNSEALALAANRLLAGDTLLRMSANIERDYSTGEKSWQSIAKGLKVIYGKCSVTKK